MAQTDTTKTLKGAEISESNIAEGIIALLHPEAQEEIRKNISNVTTWLRMRIDQLEITGDANEQCVLNLNAYNQSGLGIQSVSVGFERKGKALRPDDEFKDPTIGVITPGMVGDGAKQTIKGFGVGERHREHLIGLSDTLKLDSSTEDQLLNGSPMSLSLGTTIDVDHPSQARTILEATGVSDAEEYKGEINRGVYACIYQSLDVLSIREGGLKARNKMLAYLNGSSKDLDVETLHRFMDDVGFNLDTSPIEDISEPFRRALDGERGEETKGFSPAVTDVSKYLSAKDSLEGSDTEKFVIGLSVGGTNVKSGVAKVAKGIVDITDMDTKNLKTFANADGVIEGETEEDFWKILLPENFLNWIRTAIAKGETPSLALTLGYPMAMISGKADGRITHLAGKAKFPAMAPFDADEAAQSGGGDYPTVAESFCRYLSGNGIELDLANVAVSPNDTVSAAFANGPTFINGTGTNACVITADGKVINTELGHFKGMDVSLLDTVVASPVDFEKLVSGKTLGDIFKYAVAALLGDRNALSQKLLAMSNEEACELLFSVYPSTNGRLVRQFNEKEILFLWNVALFFVERATKFIARIGKAIEDATGEKSTYAIEGSVFAKNPDFVAKINDAFTEYGGMQRLLENRQLPVNEETMSTFGRDLDGSFVGTFVYGACVDEAARSVRN